jgi:hypothetical protein
MNDHELADVLDDAADQILFRGWGQEALIGDTTGRVCVLGAIFLACGLEEGEMLGGGGFNGVTRRHPELWDAGNRFGDALAGLLDVDASLYVSEEEDPFDLAWRWNDDQDRTAPEVEEALRLCAKRLREK